jgi:hypothetical protein
MGAEMTSHSRTTDLFEAALDACRDGESTSDFEPHFARLLDHLVAHPECHAAAVELFLNEVEQPGGSWELLQYCMYELRWPEIEAAVHRALQAAGPRSTAPLLHVLAAYEEPWPDIDLYARWKASTKARLGEPD